MMNRLFRFIGLSRWAACAVIVSGCTLLDNMAAQPMPLFEGEPIVHLASPLPNEVYAQGAAVNILGRVENAGEDVAAVEIWVDDVLIGRAETPNVSGAAAFTVMNSWPAVPGDHVVILRALRADGTQGEASVRITVQADVAMLPSPTDAQPTPSEQLPTSTPTQAAATRPPDATPTPSIAAPTQPPSADTAAQPQPTTSGAPTITVISGANIRRGPGLIFDPAIASLPAGATGTIVAISPDRQWYRITYNNGNGRGWINAAVVTTSGDLSGLPIDAGPATPTPVPPPANPQQPAAPAADTDLSITFLATTPDPLVCNQQATITVIVVNTGSTPSAETTVLVQDLYNGAQQASASATVPPLGQNESVELNLPLTVSTFFLEGHVIRARVDPDNRVLETNEGNNEVTKAYTLAQGDC